MKGKLIAIFLGIAIVVAGVSYIATDNYYLAGSIVLVYSLVSILLFVPRITKFYKTHDRFHECYHFINNYIISLSIKKSISAAFENTNLSMDQNFQSTVSKLENMNIKEKLKYLEGNYFPFHVYSIFLQIIDLYEEEGGDILEMSKYLLQEARNKEEFLSLSKAMASRKYIEMASLWGITLGILILLRFSLKDFYASIREQLFYIIALAMLFLFLLTSIFVLVLRATTIKMKGYQVDEKII